MREEKTRVLEGIRREGNGVKRDKVVCELRGSVCVCREGNDS